MSGESRPLQEQVEAEEQQSLVSTSIDTPSIAAVAAGASSSGRLDPISEPLLTTGIVIPADEIPQAPESRPDAVLLDDPDLVVSSTITQETLRKLCAQHRVPMDLVLLPRKDDKANLPPPGYTAYNRYMLWAGAIPPFNEFIREILWELGIAPAQLYPNAYAILQCVYMLYMEYLFRPPTIQDLRYLYHFKNQSGSPYSYFEVTKGNNILRGSWHKLSSIKSEWFYVVCPPGFAQRWLVRSKYYLLLLGSDYFRQSVVLLTLYTGDIPRPTGPQFAEDVRLLQGIDPRDRDLHNIMADYRLITLGCMCEGYTIGKGRPAKTKQVAYRRPTTRTTPPSSIATEEPLAAGPSQVEGLKF